jgi:DNA mismatch endonuclease (patch repair protein)
LVDQISTERRSQVMARIKGSDTGPELRTRKVAHAIGLRFRLNRRDLPGRPDLVFPKHRVALFVHGCFWHQHPGCRRASRPKSRTDYWEPKLRRNVERDALTAPALEKLGWRTVVIWECETAEPDALAVILCERVVQRPSAAT